MGAVGNYEIVSETIAFPGGVFEATIDAPDGKVVLGGGFRRDPESAGVSAVFKNHPADDGSGWIVELNAPAQDIILYAVCAEMGEC